jgi:enoyl-CoA hydratase/carnithine racemase
LSSANKFFEIDPTGEANILRLISSDNTNRLTRSCVLALNQEIHALANNARPLIITGNQQVFSVGADLNEITSLAAPEAYEFSQLGQALMNAVASFPTQVIAAIEGHCFGGGLDLALACHHRIAAPNAAFGHRGAALGLITGWGGTQRLPRLIGKARALELFIAAEKVTAQRALDIGLVDSIADDPIPAALNYLSRSPS